MQIHVAFAHSLNITENGPNMDIYRACRTAHITMGLIDVMSGCYDISHNIDQRSAV